MLTFVDIPNRKNRKKTFGEIFGGGILSAYARARIPQVPELRQEKKGELSDRRKTGNKIGDQVASRGNPMNGSTPHERGATP